MAYQGQLSGGETVTIEQRGDQTHIAVSTSGQRQSSGSGSGAWKSPPKLWATGSGAVVEIDGDRKHYVQVGAGGVKSVEQPDLEGARALDLKEVDDGAAPHMTPMKPMEPMKGMKPMKGMDEE